MRKYMLIAALVLVSATAQAAATRGLTLASADEPAVVEQPKEQLKPADAPAAAETPKYVDRPAAVNTPTEAPKVDAAKPAADNADRNVQPKRAEKPKHRQYWTESRIIGELHRHGIYW
jgi:cell division septation protein DedD